MVSLNVTQAQSFGPKSSIFTVLTLTSTMAPAASVSVGDMSSRSQLEIEQYRGNIRVTVPESVKYMNSPVNRIQQLK